MCLSVGLVLVNGAGRDLDSYSCRTVDCESRGNRNEMRPAGRKIYVYATIISYLASHTRMWKMHTSLIEMQLDTT